VTIGGALTIYGIHSYQPNASGALDTPNGNDLAGRADLSNALVNLSTGIGKLHASATVGGYAFPVVGQAINQTFAHGANTELFTVLPLVALQYNFSNSFNISAGKLASLLGQESPFTYQNINVQRGLGWSMEPTLSRCVRASYANGPWSASLEGDDAYYSGSSRAVQWIVGYSTSPKLNVQFAGIVPQSDAPPNPTTSVGNKREYDFMLTSQLGKLQLLPYVLLVNSPSSSKLGYPSNESASAVVLMATYAFSSSYSLAFRYENAANNSSPSDRSANADLVGYGPGSSARTFTFTPTFHYSNELVRLEFSHVDLSSAAPGLGFLPLGTGASQNRIGIELGLVH
jgi:hypothetical protein